MEREHKLHILLKQLLIWYEEAIVKFGDQSYKHTMLERYYVLKYYVDILSED